MARRLACVRAARCSGSATAGKTSLKSRCCRSLAVVSPVSDVRMGVTVEGASSSPDLKRSRATSTPDCQHAGGCAALGADAAAAAPSSAALSSAASPAVVLAVVVALAAPSSSEAAVVTSALDVADGAALMCAS